MKNQWPLFLLFVMAPILVGSQTLKMGVGKSAAYAVVIGISNYQNEAIPDLRFAHRDAEAFIAYLKSKAGGSLSDDQMMVLINENATTAQIAAAMDWLIETVQEGDEAVIYFSGHGDVETKTSMQHGFLLTHDSPPTTYIAGAYPLFYLQSVITTLSTERKAKVFMVMDACHSGTLAGSSIGGAEATSTVLSKQFANEIKIMSCQPNEFSLEGEQWGGGRGVFSYHLIEGLTGLADQDGDFQIKLLEVERYLEDKVAAEVAPNTQIPMTVGNKSKVIALVDEDALTLLKAQKEKETPLMAMVDSRGIEDDVLAQLDVPTAQFYKDFKNALREGPLMTEDIQVVGQKPQPLSADQLYLLLLEKPELKPLYGSMKRNLAVALQEQAQRAINDYLSIREEQVSTNSFNNQEEIGNNERFARYLARAAELLGEKHFMYKDLKSKELYFAAKADLLTSNQEYANRDTFLHAALSKLEAGLEYQSRAPHILLEMGKVYSDLGDFLKAIDYCEQASQISPMWPVPYNILAGDFFNRGDYEKAIEFAKKALALQPKYENAFSILISAYFMTERYDFIVRLCIKMMERNPGYLAAYLELGLAYSTLEQYEEAECYLLEAQKIAPEKALVYATLGEVYYDQKKYDIAEETLQKAIALDPNDSYPYSVLAQLYREQNRTDLAIKTFLAALEFYPDDYLSLGQLGLVYLQKKEYQKAWDLFQKAQVFAPEDPLTQFNFFCFCYERDEQKAAFQWLEKAFQQGLSDYLDYNEIISHGCFQRVKETKRFVRLVKKYGRE
ncbi:MAG: tetratricopeptide repeat protein [Saprospiraceae bacterium]